MSRKFIILLLSVCMFLSVSDEILAQSQLTKLQDSELRITVIYSNTGNNVTSNIMKLDMLLHHFTDNVIIKSETQVEESDLVEATHLFYYGEEKGDLDKETVKTITTFKGPLIFMGENSEQLSSLDFLATDGDIKINGINKIKGQQINPLKSQVAIKRLRSSKDLDVLLYGYKGEDDHPLLVKKDDQYIFLGIDIEEEIKYYLADMLHEMIPNNHVNEHLAYLRLEDIHPMSDPEKVLEVGEYLNERNIPYILAVIPVYITPGTGERIHFSKKSKLVEVLKYLQDTGGSVISHGYTHQYRDSETGEGFEFWDVENDQFIYSEDPTKEIAPIRNRHEFTNEKSYQAYLNKLEQREERYISKRLVASIHELSNYGLYSLAFEAPHYTMSQQGYRLTADYFPSVFGKVQLGDKHWQSMGVPPYLSSATFLEGMVLYPETIGFVDSSLQRPFQEINRMKDEALIVRDSVIGGFYHPYLGVDDLPAFLEVYESIPNMRWLDLKAEINEIKTDKIFIETDGTGEFKVWEDLTWFDHFLRESEATGLEQILWVVTLLVLLFVILFFIFTVYLRTQLKKRLFNERRR